MNGFRFSCVAAFALCLLSGCFVPNPYRPRTPEQTSTPQLPPPDSGVQTQGVPTPEPPAPAAPMQPAPGPRARSLSPASKALVAQAQTQLNSGNEALATATIERALRIEPDNPLLWIELAKVRQDTGNATQAENLARKALAMATGDNKTQAAAWRVIAESFRARGRNPEARDADSRAAALGG